MAEGAGIMSNPFIDENIYPWERPEAIGLYEALVGGTPDPTEIDLLYKRSARQLPPLNLSQAPSHMWKDALEQLARHGALRSFCELCSQHRVVAIREASSTMLTATTEAWQEREAVGRDRVAEQRPADVAMPNEAAPSVDSAIEQLRNLLVESISSEEEAKRIVRRARVAPTVNWWTRDLASFWDTALARAHTAWRMEDLFAAADEVFGANPHWHEARARYLLAREAEPLHVVKDEVDIVPPPVLSLQERRLRALGDALGWVTPRIFHDPRVRVNRLAAANTALVSINPLIEALSVAAEEETRQPMRHELQELDRTLEKHKKAVAEKLSALERVRSERGAVQLCSDLDKEATGLIAAGAEATRRLM
jgi:Effector-associated domain 1